MRLWSKAKADIDRSVDLGLGQREGGNGHKKARASRAWYSVNVQWCRRLMELQLNCSAILPRHCPGQIALFVILL